MQGGSGSGRTDVESAAERKRLGALYPIVLTEYDPRWAACYEREREYLCSVFGGCVLRVNHIGSTSVTGLIAKPTVDILLEIAGDADLAPIIDRLCGDGYKVNRPPSDIVTFIKGYGCDGYEGQTFHVHVRRLGDWGELYFRDYLRAHTETADEYGRLKLALKEKFEHDRDGYTAAKGDFIKRITDVARTEFKGRYRVVNNN